jgi:hypothetical protein
MLKVRSRKIEEEDEDWYGLRMSALNFNRFCGDGICSLYAKMLINLVGASNQALIHICWCPWSCCGLLPNRVAPVLRNS